MEFWQEMLRGFCVRGDESPDFIKACFFDHLVTLSVGI